MNQSPRYKPTAHADVCLLLEGTFPYVRGGVSSWVRQLIDGMPDLTFSIIYLGADSASHGEPVYELPDNVVHLEAHFLLDATAPKQNLSSIKRVSNSLSTVFSSLGRAKSSAEKFEKNQCLHAQLKQTRGELEVSVGDEFTRLLTGDDPITEHELETHESAWQSIRTHYAQAPEGLDFNHYFWSVRSMHGPLFKLSSVASKAPSADIYHSVSTGYAGFLGSLIVSQRQAPYIISEHGIYTKERELDLAQVDWIPEEYDPFKVGLNDNMSYLRGLWIRFFASIGKMAYASATEIFSLYEGNRRRQLADGAESSKLRVIPNGVDVARYAKVRRPIDAPVPQVIVLIGRIVPIKDIKTFIRTMQIINMQMPQVQGWLYGPEDEDEAYTRECYDLVRSLGLSEVVKFKGFDDPANIFPQVGLSVLSSVSEGQPLVVLEGFAAGIPAVTTDVGSCRELLEGVGVKDRAMGSAGSVVPIANPEALAKASIDLLSSDDAWRAASISAIERVERYYSDSDMISRYRKTYECHRRSANRREDDKQPGAVSDRAA